MLVLSFFRYLLRSDLHLKKKKVKSFNRNSLYKKYEKDSAIVPVLIWYVVSVIFSLNYWYFFEFFRHTLWHPLNNTHSRDVVRKSWCFSYQLFESRDAREIRPRGKIFNFSLDTLLLQARADARKHKQKVYQFISLDESWVAPFLARLRVLSVLTMFLVRDVYSGRFNPRADELGAGVPRRDISVHDEQRRDNGRDSHGRARRRIRRRWTEDEATGAGSFRSDVVFTLGAVSSRTWHIV